MLVGLVLSCFAAAQAQTPAGELLVLPPPAPAAGGLTANLTNPAFERAMIVDAVGPSLKAPEAIKKMVADARAAGFNTIIVQVRAFGDAYYQSSIVPRAADIPADFDPLKALLAEAKTGDKPLKVYAMLVTYRVWSRAFGKEPPAEHVMVRNPGWLCETVDGSKDFGDTGVEAWLDPGVAEVQEHLALVAVDLVKNYEVDGVVLDRLRYPDNTLKSGYAAPAVERYNQERAKTGKPEPQDADWTAWKRAQVTATLKKVRDAVKGARPNVAIAVNTITFGPGPLSLDEYRNADAYARTLQDWVAWGQHGLMDVNILMNYKSADRFASDYDRWLRFALDQAGKARVVVAVGAWLNEPRHTAAMMLEGILDPRVGGVAVSSFHSPAKAGFDSAQAFDVFRKVLDPVYVGSRSKEIAAVPRADSSTALAALARLNGLAAALGMGAPTPDPTAAVMPNLTAAAPPSLAPAQPAEPGLPMLPSVTAPAAPPVSALPPLAPPALSPATPAVPPLGSLPPLPPVPAPVAPTPAVPEPATAPAVQPAMDQSVMTMPPYAAAVAPTPAFMPPSGASLPPDLASRSAVTIPMVAGESNWQGGAMAGTDYKPRPFEAPRLDSEAGVSRLGPPPMAAPDAMKTDFSDPNSIYVPRSQPAGMRNYAVKDGRAPISARPAPATAPLEIIVLSSGKQFVGRVLDRGEQVTIQLENGGTIKIPASRVAETRAAAGPTETAPR